ncbi:MAG: hypothetical protein COA78_07035 [Blastopirellula sp.]|nr:MAG: hypothetical protein COA78_07035 [Blastopirellula sp.]
MVKKTTPEKYILIEWVEEPFAKVYGEKKFPGTRDSLPEKEANAFVNVGWAKDVATGKTGKRVPGSTPLSVDSLRIKAS